MTLFIITAIVLLLAVIALLFIPWSSRHFSRDALNRAFYQDRLAELEQDNGPASRADREQMKVELQRRLLHDIPDVSPETIVRPLGRVALVSAALVLVIVSVGVYLKISNIQRVQEWQQAIVQTPSLIERVMDPQAKPLSRDELARMGLGLRTRLQEDPDNVQAWEMLGRIGMVLNNATTATQAFERAWKLAPDNIAVKLDYAEVLTRSRDPQDNQRAGEMLQDILGADQVNIRALSLFAFNAFEQQRWQVSIDACQRLLRLLPVNDARRQAIEQTITQAKVSAGIDNVKQAVKISLTAEAEKGLPTEGFVFISVTEGSSPVPVAVKKLPLSRFPLRLTLDDTNAMMPGKLLSSLHQGVIKVHISQHGSSAPQRGDWVGESQLISFPQASPVQVIVSQQLR